MWIPIRRLVIEFGMGTLSVLFLWSLYSQPLTCIKFYFDSSGTLLAREQYVTITFCPWCYSRKWGRGVCPGFCWWSRKLGGRSKISLRNLSVSTFILRLYASYSKWLKRGYISVGSVVYVEFGCMDLALIARYTGKCLRHDRTIDLEWRVRKRLDLYVF